MAYNLPLREEWNLRVFGNSTLRRIFGPKRDENGEWNEELHSLYHSPNIVRVIKSRRLRWTGNLARMKEGRSTFKILTGTFRGKSSSGRPRRRTILEWILKKYVVTRGEIDSTQDRDYWRALLMGNWTSSSPGVSKSALIIS